MTFGDRQMEELLKKRDINRQRYHELKEVIGLSANLVELESLLNAAYNWGLFDGAITEKKGETVV
jgi:hypothetical protein